MAWVYLGIAGVLEVIWAVALKQSDGFSNAVATAVFAVAAAGSLVLLALALRSLPVGTGYAVWTGIGAIGAALVGVVWLGESANAARLLSIGLIAVGIAGLRITAGS